MWVNGRPKRPQKKADSAESIAPGMPQDWEEAASSSDRLTISYQKRRFNAHFPQKRRGETVKDRQVSDVCKLPSRAKPARCSFARPLHADSVCKVLRQAPLACKARSVFVRSALARRLRLLNDRTKKGSLKTFRFSGAFLFQSLPFGRVQGHSLIYHILLSDPSTYLIL